MFGDFGTNAVLVGRVWDPAAGGPCVVTLRDGAVVDVTSREAPTMRDLLELDDPAGWLRAARRARDRRRSRRSPPRGAPAMARGCSRRATCRRSRPAASPSPARWSSG